MECQALSGNEGIDRRSHPFDCQNQKLFYQIRRAYIAGIGAQAQQSGSVSSQAHRSIFTQDKAGSKSDIMSIKESERTFQPFKFDFRKYVPVKYYTPPEERDDQEVDKELTAIEDRLKQYKHHEWLTRTAAPSDSQAARWQNEWERYMGVSLIFTPLFAKMISNAFYGQRFNCRRLFWRTAIPGFGFMMLLSTLAILQDDKISPPNWRDYNIPFEAVKHHQQLVQKYNMFQDVQRIKEHKYAQVKDFDEAVKSYNLRTREAKRSYLTDFFRNKPS